MAREVNATLGKIIAEQRSLTEAQGEDVVKRLRTSNLYQVSLFSVPTISALFYLHIFCLSKYWIGIEMWQTVLKTASSYFPLNE